MSVQDDIWSIIEIIRKRNETWTKAAVRKRIERMQKYGMKDEEIMMSFVGYLYDGLRWGNWWKLS